MPKKDESPEEKLVMVGDGSHPPEDADEESTQTLLPEEKAEGEESDEGVGEEEHAEAEADEGDERVGHSEEEDDPDRKALRERRRKERKERRERDARNRRELAFLRKRNEQVERQLSEIALRQNHQEQVSIDQRIGTLDGQIREAEEIHAAAVKAADGVTATEALRVKDQLRAARDGLVGAKSKVESERPRERAAPERDSGPEPEVQVQIRSWMERNEWFDPRLRDETSHLVKAMEDRLASEQIYSADSPEYWEELDRRVAKRFPELRGGKKKKKNSHEEIFDEDDDDDDEEEAPQRRQAAAPAPKRKGGGPRFSVGGRTRSLKPNEVYIDAERRAALEELGVMEDPVLRDRYLGSYKRYDDEARQTNKTR